MPVAELSLNELSRQVGLAKSNVLRYFETREAILLELLSAELRAWAELLDILPTANGAAPRQRIDHLARLVTDSLAERPLLCDLASAQAAVLERNVSTAVVLTHKLAVREAVERLADTFRRHLPELTHEDALQAISVALLMTAAAWPHSTPTQAALDAYDAEPGLAELHLDFADYIRSTLETVLSGIFGKKNRFRPGECRSARAVARASTPGLELDFSPMRPVATCAAPIGPGDCASDGHDAAGSAPDHGVGMHKFHNWNIVYQFLNFTLCVFARDCSANFIKVRIDP